MNKNHISKLFLKIIDFFDYLQDWHSAGKKFRLVLCFGNKFTYLCQRL